jgi:hypothetical protein
MEKNNILELDDESELCISDGGIKYERGKIMNLIGKQVLTTQLRLTLKTPSYDNLQSEKRKWLRHDLNSMIAMQKKLIKAINDISLQHE